MHLECHLMVGWTLANLAGADARTRRWTSLAAVLPDLDALPYVISPLYYARYHHTFGHNVFLGLLLAGMAARWLRMPKAAGCVLAGFASHLLTDACLSGWNLYLFWPLNRAGFLFPGALQLDHPVNTLLAYAAYAAIVPMALAYGRTPLELIWPSLDRLLISAWARRRFHCRQCDRKANQSCSVCGESVCWSHARVTSSCRVRCPLCAEESLAGTDGSASPGC